MNRRLVLASFVLFTLAFVCCGHARADDKTAAAAILKASNKGVEALAARVAGLTWVNSCQNEYNGYDAWSSDGLNWGKLTKEEKEAWESAVMDWIDPGLDDMWDGYYLTDGEMSKGNEQMFNANGNFQVGNYDKAEGFANGAFNSYSGVCDAFGPFGIVTKNGNTAVWYMNNILYPIWLKYQPKGGDA